MCTSGCDSITNMKRSFLYQYSCNCSFSFIQLCLDHKTTGSTVRICLQFHYFCCQKDHFQKLLDSFFCVCRYRYEDRTSAPVFRDQFILCQLLLYPFDIGTWLINLVNGNNNLDSGCFCVVDRLDRLRHNTIIRCYNKDRDIRRICSTHTHCCKCFMSRSIKECDLLSVDLDNGCTDVLCNTAGLTSCYITVTDRIQKRSLTMVNVSHNADNRRTFHHQAFIFLILFQEFFDYIHDLFLLTQNIKFHCDLFSSIVINLLIYRNNFSLQEQLLYDHRRNNLHLVGKFFDRKNFWNHDLLDLLFLLFFRLILRFLYFDHIFLLFAFFALALKCLVSVFFLLIISLFIFRLISLALLLLDDWSCVSVRTVISAVIIFSVRTRSLTISSITVIAASEPLFASASCITVVTRSSFLTLTSSVSIRTSASCITAVTNRTVLSVTAWTLWSVISLLTYRSSLSAGTSCCLSRSFCAYRSLCPVSSLLTRTCLSCSLCTHWFSLCTCCTYRTVLSSACISLCCTASLICSRTLISLQSAAISGILRTHYKCKIFLLWHSAVLFCRFFCCRFCLCRFFISAGIFSSNLFCHVILHCTHMILNFNIFLFQLFQDFLIPYSQLFCKFIYPRFRHIKQPPSGNQEHSFNAFKIPFANPSSNIARDARNCFPIACPRVSLSL